MTVRMLRSTIQGEMRRDYVRTAISRGNDRGAVLRRHVLRNALVPVVTFLAQTMAEIVAAGIVVEQVFAIPGLGRLLVASISNPGLPRGAGHRGDPGLLGGAGRHRGRHCQPADRPRPAAGRCVMKRRMNGYLLAGLIGHRPHGGADPGRPGVDALRPGRLLQAQAGGPLLAHWLGTDSFGRDIFSRVLQGAGTTFLIALSTVAIGAVCGTAAGALTGYFGGVVDEVLMRLNDALTAFPSILLALVLISILGPGNKYNVVIALGIVFIPSFARVTRTAFAALRDVNYVKSARLMGASSGRILVRQILPNTTQVLLPAITIGFNNAVLAEASMSYLGIGVTPPDASLGYMLSEAQGMLTSAPWYALGVPAAPSCC